MNNAIRVQNWALVYLCVWTFAPPLAYEDAYRYAAVFAGLIWSVMELTRSDNIFARPTIPVLLSGAYLLYTLAVEWALGPEADFAWHIQPAIMLFFLVVYESRRRMLGTLVPVFWWTLATLPIWLAISLVALSRHGHAARVIVRASEEALELTEQGVGGYALVYFSLALLPVLITLTVRRREKYLKGMPHVLRYVQGRLPVFTGVTALLAALFIFKAQYSIAIYLTALVLLAIFVPRRHAVAIAVVGIPIAIVMLQEGPMVRTLEAAGSVVQGTNAGNKINDLLTTLQEDRAFGTVGDRMERYARSTEIFLESPLFGVLEFRDVGKHSSYLDRFARYGVVIGGIFVYLLLYVPVRMMKRTKAAFGMAFAVFTVALLFPALNTVFMGLGTALYIMFPAACSLLSAEPVKRPWPAPSRAVLDISRASQASLPQRRET